MSFVIKNIFRLNIRTINLSLRHCSSNVPYVFNRDELIKMNKDWIIDHNYSIDALSEVKNADVEFINEISPSLKKSFNLAAYINQSSTLQELLKLNIDLSKIERNVDLASYLVRCDFEVQIKPYILFLLDMGIQIEQVGDVINKNPILLTIPLEDLQIRVNYFLFRKFSKDAITNMFLKSPIIFNNKTTVIDVRLGLIQKSFSLTSLELRNVITSYPRLINLNELQVKDTNFMFKEELGFNETELKHILLNSPILWRKFHKSSGHKNFVQVFDYLHNDMGLTHQTISKYSPIFNRRFHLIRQRHLYLKSLKRDQFDPCKPLYVPLSAFYGLSDAEFCFKYCKTSVNDFNQFLKTL